MAKNKRTLMSADMNNIDMNDMSSMTDQEREQLQGSRLGAGKRSQGRNPKKAM